MRLHDGWIEPYSNLGSLPHFGVFNSMHLSVSSCRLPNRFLSQGYTSSRGGYTIHCSLESEHPDSSRCFGTSPCTLPGRKLWGLCLGTRPRPRSFGSPHPRASAPP